MTSRSNGVSGSNYVVHMLRPGYRNGHRMVWCGRRADRVNSVELGTGDGPTEEHCLACVRAFVPVSGEYPRK